MSGARAVLALDDGSGPKIVGVFQEVSWSLVYDDQPVFVLGAEGPVEIVMLGQQPVQVNCSAFKVPGHGAYADMKFPPLQMLLQAGEITISIHDRQQTDPNVVVMKVHGCKPSSYSSGVGAKRAQEMQVSFIGTTLDEDDVQAGLPSDASRLPDASV